MNVEWREILYPLGFLSTLAFSSRMLLQWMTSEVKGKSIVTPLFWKLSIIGNLLLALHSFIQVQFHVCLIQGCNAVISWRNLNLMQPAPSQVSFKHVIGVLCAVLCSITIFFFLQGYFLLGNTQEWFRIPTAPWQSLANSSVTWKWHLLGTFGLILFNSRFWLQWGCAERHQRSYLGSSFWLVSLIGEGLCLAYFWRINDPVNYIGPAFGMIPYIRNLMLIYKQKKQPTQEV